MNVTIQTVQSDVTIVEGKSQLLSTFYDHTNILLVTTKWVDSWLFLFFSRFASAAVCDAFSRFGCTWGYFSYGNTPFVGLPFARATRWWEQFLFMGMLGLLFPRLFPGKFRNCFVYPPFYLKGLGIHTARNLFSRQLSMPFDSSFTLLVARISPPPPTSEVVCQLPSVVICRNAGFHILATWKQTTSRSSSVRLPAWTPTPWSRRGRSRTTDQTLAPLFFF